MEDAGLEQARANRMDDLRQQFAQQQAEEEKRLQAEQRVELLLKKLLTPEAKSRLKNVRLVNQNLYWASVQQILVLFRSGRLQGTISEPQVKRILESLSSKREIKIKRK